ncbi:hypothetical protein MG293_004540 [Ovis ammon polii]|uniref:Uncharacterized protein n=1 Tax=Ovis ammon polii TaxID=230172 RepID=A0AAD4UGH6_OVIAM|nr:hypothetical protein MG293_004540 [Ovis ammon polii]
MQPCTCFLSAAAASLELSFTVPGATHVSEDPKAESPKVLPVSSPPSNHIPQTVVDSILAIKKQDEPIDVFVIEIMEMKHKSETDTGLIRGLVMDHGARHPDMKKRVEDAYSLTCDVSLEYEKTEVNSGFFFYKRLVYEYTLGEEKFTFIEKCNNPRSITLLIKGPNKHTLTQIKDAIRDGLRAVKNAIDDGRVVPGAGAVEVSMAEALVKYKPSVKDTAQLRVQAFADALLIISKVLVQNSGFDLQETLVKIQAEHSESSQLVGVDLNTVEPMVAAEAGI